MIAGGEIGENFSILVKIIMLNAEAGHRRGGECIKTHAGLTDTPVNLSCSILSWRALLKFLADSCPGSYVKSERLYNSENHKSRLIKTKSETIKTPLHAHSPSWLGFTQLHPPSRWCWSSQGPIHVLGWWLLHIDIVAAQRRSGIITCCYKLVCQQENKKLSPSIYYA